MLRREHRREVPANTQVIFGQPLTPYDVTYNGSAHSATGTATGINGALLTGLTVYSVHTNAGTYTDSWMFSNTNYTTASWMFPNTNCTTGTFTDIINKANARIIVTPYNVVFNDQAHTATGYALGVNGSPLAGLNLSGTVHLGGYYTNTFHDRWTFTDTTGNYNNTSGTVVDTIRANPALYRAVFHPFFPKSPFYGRLYMW